MLWNIAGRSSTSLAFAGRARDTPIRLGEMRLHRGPLVVEDRAEEDARR